MLPVLIGLNTFVVILTPSHGLVDHLLDAKALHLIFVLKDVVEDGFSHAVEVVLVDFVEHGVNKVLNAFLLDGMQITGDQLNDMSEPVLADGCNHIDLDLILDILSVSMVRDLTGMHVRVSQNLVVHDGFILLVLVGGVDVVLINDVQLGA